MVNIKSNNNNIAVNVHSAGKSTSLAIGTPQSYYDGLSKQWAISDKLVSGEDYSSKYYAQESKKQANIATEQAKTTINKVTEINSVTTAALNDIENERSAAVTEITTAQNQAVEALETAQSTAIESINTTKTTAISDVTTTAQTQITNIQQEGATQVSNIQQTGFYMDNGKLYYLDEEGNPQEFKQGGGSAGLVAGFLYKPTGAIDESENIFRYANGQICAANDSIKGLLKWLNKQKAACPSVFCTEEEWQTAVTLSPFGQCGKYVLNYQIQKTAIECKRASCMLSGDSVIDIAYPEGTELTAGSIVYKVTAFADDTEYILGDPLTIESYTVDELLMEDDKIKFVGDTTTYTFNQISGTSTTYYSQTVTDEIESVRLPKIINEQGCFDLSQSGITKAESLPNIKGTANCSGGTAGFDASTGALKSSGSKSTGNGKTSSSYENMIKVLSLNASNYNAIYQDNAHVQQEAIQYPYVICVNTGVEEAERPINNYQVNNVYSYGMSQYYKGTMNNNSWLRSAGQWNSGTIYTGLYEWLLGRKNAGDSDVKTVNYTMSYSAENWENIDHAFDGNPKTLAVKEGQGSDLYITFDTPVVIKGLSISGKSLAKKTAVGLLIADGSYLFELYSVDENSNTSALLGSATRAASEEVGALYELEITCAATEVTKLRLACHTATDNGARSAKISEICVDVVDTAISDYDYILNTANQTFRLPLKNGQEGVFADKVKGNGIALGLTGGSSANERGLVWSTSTPDHFLGRATAYGVAVGTTTSSGGDDWTNGAVIGVTTDSSKSGLEVDLTVPEGYNLYYYVGDTLQNADLIDVARMADDVATAKNEALSLKTEFDKYKANQITYETEWFDISTSGRYAFALENKKITQCDYSKVSVQLVAKVKTATTYYAVGDIVYLDYANYNGNTSAKEIGCTIFIHSDVLNIYVGNDTNIANGCSADGLPKANVQCKIILKGEL